jgi:hypothetical protein
MLGLLEPRNTGALLEARTDAQEMGMKIRTYVDAARFLRHTQAALETNEAANSLMLGICG